MNKNIKIQQIKLDRAEDFMDKRKKKKKQDQDKEEKDKAAKILKSVGQDLKTEFKQQQLKIHEALQEKLGAVSTNKKIELANK